MDRSIAWREPDRAFLGVSALLFAASAAATIGCCVSMAAMGGMPMAGGWAMSMMWMRMPGQTWPGAAAAFLAMWLVMTAAMMLPSLTAMQLRYRQAVRASGGTLGMLTALVGAGYFAVWAAVGIAVYAIGTTLATIGMQWPPVARLTPLAGGGIVLLAGLFQFTRWKARLLECCRESPGRDCDMLADARVAWRHGLRLGLHCSGCCAGLTAALLALGAMDLRAMSCVTVAILAERFAADGRRIARAAGAILVVAGLVILMSSS